MTLSIRARVKRHDGCWASCAYSVTTDEATGLPIANHHRFERDHSWAEALQSAYAMLAALDRELMRKVHESRARRRDPSPCTCAECAVIRQSMPEHQEATA